MAEKKKSYEELGPSGGYDSISSSRKWLNGTRDHDRDNDALNSLKIILMFILMVLVIYLVIISILGSVWGVPKEVIQPDAVCVKNKTCFEEFSRKAYAYFWISGVIAISIVMMTMYAVIRESPILSMLCSIFMVLAAAQSFSNLLHNLPTSYYIFDKLVVSPAAIMCLVGCLLAIYTSIIWSSEFETPPHVIEEYKWYLNQIRSRSEHRAHLMQDSAAAAGVAGTSSSSSSSTFSSLVAAGAAAVVGTSCGTPTPHTMSVAASISATQTTSSLNSLSNSMDDVTSSYHSSASS